jgi:hypothetical protein
VATARTSGSSRPRSRAQIAQRLQRSVGDLSTASLARMERETPWVAELSAQDRSLIGLIVQAGIKAFVEWYRDPARVSPLRAEVFGAAPRAFAGTITLQQTVELIRLSIEVVEENVTAVVGEADAPQVRQAIDSYAREVAFATAEIYARAAEQRGAWDARLEALVVDALLRGGEGADSSDHALVSRASALGWSGNAGVLVMVGGLDEAGAIDDVRRFAHDRTLDCLCAVQGSRLVVILGGVDADGRPAPDLAGVFAPGPVVVGPVVPDLSSATRSASAALSGLRAARGWPDAPRPVRADELLPERALDGDAAARDQLVERVHDPLAAAGAAVLETVRAYLESGSTVEGTARTLFVHPNTVRYRLRRATELTGFSPADPRDGYALRVALTLGRLDGRSAL